MDAARAHFAAALGSAVASAGCFGSFAVMHPADVLRPGEVHIGYAVGAAAPAGGFEGDLADAEAAGPEQPAYREAATRQVAAPVGLTQEVQLRYGLSERLEGGLRAGASTLGLDVRWQFFREISTQEQEKWVATLGGGVGAQLLSQPLLAPLDALDVDGASRFDVHAEMLVGRNFGDAIHVWVGPKVTAGQFAFDGAIRGAPVDASGRVFQVGGVFGLAVGYRRIFAAAELAVAQVLSDAELDGAPFEASSVVLYPSFGSFVRF